MEKRKIPSEITVLLSIEVLGGVFNLVEGLLNIHNFQNMNSTSEISNTMIAIGNGLGVILTFIGLMSFLVSYGLMKKASWAWTGAKYLAILDLILGIISFPASILIIIIDVFIIYYLSRPQVKKYLGKL